MGFQTQVNLTPAPAVEGDFASSNPRDAVVAPESGFVAGAAGVTVGSFAWVQADGKTVLNTGTGVPDGFIHRKMQALITDYLSESSMLIRQGFAVTVMRTGDYYDLVTVNPSTRGQKAFASLTDGTMQPAAAGATIGGFIETPFVINSVAAVGELATMTY